MKKKILLFTVIAAITVNYSVAQNNNALWQAAGPDTVKTNRFVKVNNSAKIAGYLVVDSLKVKNMMVVGDPLTISWACPTCPVVRNFTASYFGASENALVLEGGFPTSSLAVRDNIRYGIGYFPLAAGPAERLHLNDNRSFFGISTNVFELFTNFNTGSAGTDGFRVGVTGGIAANAGHALLNNQEPGKHILLQTNNGNVGINTAVPVNKLQITSGVAATTLNPINAVAPTRSGLRFSNLNNTMAPDAVTNPSANVLSVNSTGDIIMVPGGTGTGDVIACTSSPITTNFLPKWSPASNKELCNSQFVDDGVTTAINTLDPLALFNVPATAPAVSNAGIFVLSGTANTTFNTGVQGISTVSGGQINVGVRGIASGTGFNTAGWFSASGAGNTAVSASVPNGVNQGIAVSADGQGAGTFAGFFNGDVFINNGTFSGNGYVSGSDAMLKTNVNSISNALSLVEQLQPKSFYFDTTNAYNIRLSSKKQYGFVAQDVESILPELIYTTHKPAERDSAGNITFPTVDYKSLNYQALIGILVGAVQAQQVQIDSLKNNLRIQPNIQNLPSQSVTLASQRAILYQNNPNPMNGETSIGYYLADETINAEMVFYDMYSNEIKRVVLENKGNAKLEVNTKDLASGIYSYSLIADGKVINTMKMIRAK